MGRCSPHRATPCYTCHLLHSLQQLHSPHPLHSLPLPHPTTPATLATGRYSATLCYTKNLDDAAAAATPATLVDTLVNALANTLANTLATRATLATNATPCCILLHDAPRRCCDNPLESCPNPALRLFSTSAKGLSISGQVELHHHRCSHQARLRAMVEIAPPSQPLSRNMNERKDQPR